MTDSSRLSRSLTKLGTRRESSRILRDGPRPLLASLLAAADDIILERHMTLTPGAGAPFGLIVANRRLVGVTSDQHAEMTETANEALRAGVSPDDKQALAAIQDWFEAHLQEIGEVRISIGMVAEDQLQQAMGIAADQLADALSLSLDDAPELPRATDNTDLIDRFQGLIGDMPKTWVRLSRGGIAGASNPADDTLSGLTMGASTSEPRLWMRAGGDGQLTVNAHAEADELVARCDGKDLSRLAAAWHEALTG